MRAALVALLLLTASCRDENGNRMPSWDGSFCDHVDGGVKCEDRFIAYGSPEFKALWITDKKGTFCLFKQYVNNCKEWVDDDKRCEFEDDGKQPESWKTYHDPRR